MTQENIPTQESELTHELVFNYSIENEINRVRNTLNRYEWYKEQGYKIKFPELITEKLNNGEEITDDVILEAVSTEFNADLYREPIALIEEEWKSLEGKFFENLEILGLPTQNKYDVFFTTYGTGGST